MGKSTISTAISSAKTELQAGDKLAGQPGGGLGGSPEGPGPSAGNDAGTASLGRADGDNGNVGIAMPLAPSPSHHHFYGWD